MNPPWLLPLGVVMAGIALVLALWVIFMLRHLADQILDRLDTKIIEEIVEELPHHRAASDGMTHAQRTDRELRRGVPGWRAPRAHGG